ncbi:MAG: hypothetical protein E7124_10240 [Bacteroidales bacterium]|nr:hypothetical protein [Bacteroidales bacterium]
MKRILFILTLALVALAGCKKETPEPVPEQNEPAPAPEQEVFVITPAKDSEWAGGAIQISANREVASWSHEMVIPEVGDKANYSESSSLSTSISESGLVTLGMYLNRFAAKIFEPTTMTLRITATSVDGETATCEVASMGWATRFYLCSDEEVRNPEKVAVGDIVCIKFTDPSHGITDEEFLKDVKVIADNGQVKLTPVKREGNHFQYKVEKTTGGKITLQLGIKASYGAYTEEIHSVDVVVGGADELDVSLSPAANCYIVTETGTHSFRTVKGNTSDSVGSVAFAEVLWESFGTDQQPAVGDLVKNVWYKDGVITFTSTDKKGNAVIAAKDASGEILWSWHIWLTDQPKEHVYKNNAGTMMDRNLGAISAIPGHVRAFGLLYQWGRKDPFLGASAHKHSLDIEAKSTITWPSAVETSSSVGTVGYVTSHPTTVVYSRPSVVLDPNADWHYSFRDNSLWTPSDKPKSIYDPCPAGWRVPDGGSDGVWAKAGFDEATFDNANEGIYVEISSSSGTTWYPNVHGYRVTNFYFSNDSDYWSASPSVEHDHMVYTLGLKWDGMVELNAISYRYVCNPVRCIKD